MNFAIHRCHIPSLHCAILLVRHKIMGSPEKGNYDAILDRIYQTENKNTAAINSLQMQFSELLERLSPKRRKSTKSMVKVTWHARGDHGKAIASATTNGGESSGMLESAIGEELDDNEIQFSQRGNPGARAPGLLAESLNSFSALQMDDLQLEFKAIQYLHSRQRLPGDM